MLRLCFIVLFGTMAVMHGPLMTFSTAHTAEHGQAERSRDAMPDCHEDEAPPARHAQCNAFACFMAVEPIGVTARPLHRILFAVMAAAPAASLDPVQTTPALPPPRILG